MSKHRAFVLPWEPDYTAHREAQRRRDAIHAALAAKERHLHEADAPSIAPDHPEEERELTYTRAL